MDKNGKKKSRRDEDSNANADHIPENWRASVQRLKEMFINRSEQEIYLTILECNLSIEGAINRLLSQDSFQEVKSKRDKNKEVSLREIVQSLKKVVNCSEQKIYEVLLECNMDADKALNRLLSQDSFQEVKSKQDKNKEVSLSQVKEKSIMGERDKESNVNPDNVPADMREIVQSLKKVVNCPEQKIYEVLLECNMDVDKALNRLLSQDDLLKGSGNKFSSDGNETSNVQGIHNHLADSSGILGCGPPLNSNVSNVKAERVTVSLDEAVPSLDVSSSLGCDTHGKRTMADVVKTGLASSKENVTKAPEKPDFPNQFSNSSINSAAKSDQLQESVLVSNKTFCNDDSKSSSSLGLASSKAPEKRFIDSAAKRDQLQESDQTSRHLSGFLNDNSQLLNAVVAPVEQRRQRQNVNIFPNAMLQQAYSGEMDPRYSASPLNQSMASASSLGRRPSVPMIEVNRQAIGQHYSQPEVPVTVVPYGSAYGSMNASAFGSTYRSPSGSAYGSTNPSHIGSVYSSTYRSPVGSAYGSTNPSPIGSVYSSTYSSPSGSAYGSTNPSPIGSVYSSTYRSPSGSAYGSTNPSPIGSVYSSTNPSLSGSTYGSTNGSAYSSVHGSAYGSSMWNDNAANSRLGYDDDYSSQLANHFASLFQPNGNSNVWDPQGQNDSRNNYHRLFNGHDQNQQSPSFRHIQQQQLLLLQQQQHQQEQQQNRRRDPSNQTKKEPWPRNNYK